MTIKTFMMTAVATTALMTGAASAEMHSDKMGATTETQSETMMTPSPESDTEIGITTDMGMQADVETDEMMPMSEGTDVALADKTVGDVLGMDVESINGNDVGEIDYVIEGENGVEAVVGVGGLLGLGEYTVALPLSDFTMTDDDTLMLSLHEDELKKMPEIDEANLESLPDDMIIADAMAEAETMMPDNS